jgi:hypothetical protein
LAKNWPDGGQRVRIPASEALQCFFMKPRRVAQHAVSILGQ